MIINGLLGYCSATYWIAHTVCNWMYTSTGSNYCSFSLFRLYHYHLSEACYYTCFLFWRVDQEWDSFQRVAWHYVEGEERSPLLLLCAVQGKPQITSRGSCVVVVVVAGKALQRRLENERQREPVCPRVPHVSFSLKRVRCGLFPSYTRVATKTYSQKTSQKTKQEMVWNK